MEFIKHTLNWFKGESFEGGMIILWGLLVIALAIYFWKFGHSSTIRIMIIPFFVVGLFWSGAGSIGSRRTDASDKRAYPAGEAGRSSIYSCVHE